MLVNNNMHRLAISGLQAATCVYKTVFQPIFQWLAYLPETQLQSGLQDRIHNFRSAMAIMWPSFSYCLKLMLYEPVFGSLSALKLSRDMPNLPKTVLPNSFNLPAQAHSSALQLLAPIVPCPVRFGKAGFAKKHVVAQHSTDST